jgi:hypothetical protein
VHPILATLKTCFQFFWTSIIDSVLFSNWIIRITFYLAHNFQLDSSSYFDILEGFSCQNYVDLCILWLWNKWKNKCQFFMSSTIFAPNFLNTYKFFCFISWLTYMKMWIYDNQWLGETFFFKSTKYVNTNIMSHFG